MTEGFVFWEVAVDSDRPICVRVYNNQPRAFVRNNLVPAYEEASIMGHAIADLSAERDRYKALYYELKAKVAQ